MKRVKIAIISENYPPDSGGIAVSAQRLAFSLSSVVDIHVVCFPRGNPNIQRTHLVRHETDRYIVHEFRPFVNGWSIAPDPKLRAMVLSQTAQDVASVLGKEDINIIHGFGLQNAGLVAARVSLLLNLPLIQSIRGNDVGRNAFDGMRRIPLGLALSQAKLIVPVNRWTAELVTLHFPFTIDRIKVIGNGVRSPGSGVHNPNQESVSLLRLPPCGPIVGFVGKLREKKGPHVISLIVNEFIGIRSGRFLIIGDKDIGHFRDIGWTGGSLDERFMTVVRARDYCELCYLIRLCDWLVFPSLDDGMANGVLEAMSCSRPVICSTAFSDVVRDWKDGIIASPYSPHEYLTACELLWSDPDLRKILGSSAQQHVELNFSIEAERKSWIEAYDMVMN